MDIRRNKAIAKRRMAKTLLTHNTKASNAEINAEIQKHFGKSIDSGTLAVIRRELGIPLSGRWNQDKKQKIAKIISKCNDVVDRLEHISLPAQANAQKKDISLISSIVYHYALPNGKDLCLEISNGTANFIIGGTKLSISKESVRVLRAATEMAEYII